MMESTWVWSVMKVREKRPPSTAKMAQEQKARNTPLTAAWLAVSKFFSPKLLESRALMPTPVPTATEIMRFWAGKARPTAARASSLI